MAKLTNTAEKSIRPTQKRTAERPVLPDKQTIEYSKAQDHLLVLALMQPSLRTYLASITPEMIARDEGLQLFEILRTNPKFTGQSSAEANLLRPIAEYVKILGLQYEELYQDLDSTELQYEAARLRARMAENYVKQQKQYIAAQLEDANEAEIVILLKRVKQLDALLNQTKGGA